MTDKIQMVNEGYIEDIDHSIELRTLEAQKEVFDKLIIEINMLKQVAGRITDREEWDRGEILNYIYGKALARLEAANQINEQLNESETETDDTNAEQ